MRIEDLLSLAVWLAGVGHFVLLFAGAQVPYRMRWKEDLTRVSPFNRKLLWTYYGFTGLTIVAFGILTFALHDEFVRGDRPALFLAGYIGVFWIVRILVDFTYYRHADWPRGRAFAVGHALLFGLFVALAGTYLGLVARHTVFS